MFDIKNYNSDILLKNLNIDGLDFYNSADDVHARLVKIQGTLKIEGADIQNINSYGSLIYSEGQQANLEVTTSRFKKVKTQ